MTYSKPEIAVLGDAVRAIQSNKPKAGIEGPLNQLPAYELDDEQ